MANTLAIALGVLGGVVLHGAVLAQPQGSPSGDSTPHHVLAERCAAAFDKTVGEGRGFGMAFVADRNGYPGPLHVLELRELLKLTPEQEAKVQELLAAMFAESRPKGARLLAAEDKIRRLFADGRADEASVRAAVAEAERARTETRLVHLGFHLKTRDLLTPDQRRRYHDARWSPHDGPGHHGGGAAPGGPGHHGGATAPDRPTR